MTSISFRAHSLTSSVCSQSFSSFSFFFFFNDTATTEIYTLSLHDALPIYAQSRKRTAGAPCAGRSRPQPSQPQDRKSTRLNSSHGYISYAVFCLKKKKKKKKYPNTTHE